MVYSVTLAVLELVLYRPGWPQTQLHLPLPSELKARVTTSGLGNIFFLNNKISSYVLSEINPLLFTRHKSTFQEHPVFRRNRNEGHDTVFLEFSHKHSEFRMAPFLACFPIVSHSLCLPQLSAMWWASRTSTLTAGCLLRCLEI